MSLKCFLFLLNFILIFGSIMGQSNDRLTDIYFPTHKINNIQNTHLYLSVESHNDSIIYSLDDVAFREDSLQFFLTSVVETIPERLKNKIVLDLAIDRNVSLKTYKNIVESAKRSGIYRIGYINRNGDSFIRGLRGDVDENEPIGEFNYPCMVHKGKFVSVLGEYIEFRKTNYEEYDDLKNCLDSCFNCQYNLVYIELQNDKFLFDEKTVMDTVLLDKLFAFVKENKIATEKTDETCKIFRDFVVILKTDYESTFEKYLKAYIQINEFYITVWERESQRLYNGSYNDLKFADMKKIRTSIPFTTSTFILSEEYWD